MVFVSLTFLFLFLPCVLGLYYLFRKHRGAQNALLLLASLFFYAWGEPKFLVIFLFSILFNWLLALLISRSKTARWKKLFVILSVIVNIGLLFVFKYLNFFADQLNSTGLMQINIGRIALPLGISFFTFQAMSYVIDVYWGETCQKNPLSVGLYIAFFPQLVAGPIVRYNSIAEQLVNRKESLEAFKAGTLRFVQGFVKKIFLANTMAVIADKAFAGVGADLTVSFAWLGAVAYALQIFFDFSAYSDMAIGLGKMFGFQFDENFNHPYTACSVTDFWRRWHISLSTWFRDYVYIPLGGNRTGSAFRNYVNLFVVWFLTGFWHGANWTFIAWGLLYFIALLLEKATAFGAFLKRFKALGHIYTLLVVLLLWVFFRAEGIGQACAYMKTMFGLSGAALYSGQTLVYLRENIVYLLFALLLSANVVPKIVLSGKLQRAIQIIGEVVLAILFAASIVYIINGTYNPFIYFHF